MTVNELARATDVPPGEVRYYARRGLLPFGRDPGNGYRCFDADALVRLRFVATARTLGFPLKEIARLVNLADAGASPCPGVRELPERRIAGLAAPRRALAPEQAWVETVCAHRREVPDGTPGGRGLCPLLDGMAPAPGARPGAGAAGEAAA